MRYKENKTDDLWVYKIYLDHSRFKDEQFDFQVAMYRFQWQKDNEWSIPEVYIRPPSNMNMIEALEWRQGMTLCIEKMEEMKNSIVLPLLTARTPEPEK